NMGAADKAPVTSDQQAAVDNETSKRQTLSPEQQMAAATTPPPLKEADNSKVDKESDKGNKISATDEKNNSDASDNTKGSSQNTSEDKTPASASQNKIPAAGPEQLHPAKTPFLTELSQSVIGAESKTIGTGTLQLPTGLLVVQEVNPNGLQANAVAAQSQIKPAPSHVSPEMVTKQISLAIMKQVSEGQESFKISLKPAHLGQVDIKMDFHTDGKMVATVTVDNDRTLALLQKDQGALEKALENAGFDAGGNSLNFSLKQQQGEGQAGFANNNTGDGESDDMSSLPGSIISHQQMKMAYSDNLLDINI
ncbi:MAG: flagellar hook-length control protein FliK, partial [Emcibacter sp.]|nr:flagellar hook-length control protein FliK [Emcibacter sp.]